MITLVDTSELKQPTQRKLHAAWRELQGERVLAPPGVADELAPLAANVLWREGPSEAEHTLQSRTLPDRRRRQLQQQAWWGRMWTDPTSPYRIVTLDPAQTDRAERLRTVMDPRCFPNAPPEDIPDLGDAVIVSEAMALDARLLLTSNLQKHPDPERLVELTRRHLPSPTISTDRAHPSFPERPGTSFLQP